MHIWTSTPNDEIWRQLRYLSSVANVENILAGKMACGRKEKWEPKKSKDAATEVSACVQQADEYFSASRDVSLATRPLLLFYGIESLAKAVILANNPALNLRLINYHGLSTRPSVAQEKSVARQLREYIDKPEQWKLECEFAVSNNGVFPELSSISGDVVIPPGYVLKFKDLLRVIPDVANLFTRHYGERSHCFYLYSGPEVQGDNCQHIYFSEDSCVDVLTVFPEFCVGFEPSRQHDVAAGFKKLDSANIDFGVVEEGTIAGRYFVRPLGCGLHKSMPLLFAAMFILSNVVRYKPDFWMDIIDGRKTGSVSIAESLCNICERRFPSDVLSAIWHESFTFGAPGYLS
jgi:hypothetical protein